MKFSSFITALTFLAILNSCKNYQNEMIEWTSSIQPGTEIAIVKENQPDFLTIDWNNPDSLKNNRIRYAITEIQGFNDSLGMSYYLEFQNNGYQGLIPHK